MPGPKAPWLCSLIEPGAPSVSQVVSIANEEPQLRCWIILWCLFYKLRKWGQRGGRSCFRLHRQSAARPVWPHGVEAPLPPLYGYWCFKPCSLGLSEQHPPVTGRGTFCPCSKSPGLKPTQGPKTFAPKMIKLLARPLSNPLPASAVEAYMKVVGDAFGSNESFNRVTECRWVTGYELWWARTDTRTKKLYMWKNPGHWYSSFQKLREEWQLLSDVGSPSMCWGHQQSRGIPSYWAKNKFKN